MPPDSTTPPNTPHPASYDFIMNPQQAPKQPKLKLPGAGPTGLLARVALVGGGLIVLVILFSVIKGLIIKGPDFSGYVTVAEDQQELIHLVSNSASNSSQQNLDTNNQNLAATAQLSLASNQAQVLKYLSENHHKVSSKTLGLRLNTALDTQLTNAQTAGTYDQTFQSIMQSQLNGYMNDLKHTFQTSTGKKGRAMLSSQYNQAVLLLNQASVPND